MLSWRKTLTGLALGAVATNLVLAYVYLTPLDDSRIPGNYLTICVALVAAAVIYLAVWRLPAVYVRQQCHETGEGATSEKDRIDLEIKLRDVMLKAVGAAVAILGLWIGWQQFQVKQSDDQYAKAVELISSKSVEMRTSGVYLLGQLAEVTPRKYHWKVIQHCASLVRQHAVYSKEQESRVQEFERQLGIGVAGVRPTYEAPMDSDSLAYELIRHDYDLAWELRGVPPEDVQAGLNIIGLRDVEGDPRYFPSSWRKHRMLGIPLAEYPHSQTSILRKSLLNFADCYMPFITAREADFDSAVFRGTNLQGSDLFYAIIANADMRYADLVGANLTGADCSGTNLIGADLRRSSLANVNLEQANLYGVQLDGAHCYGTNFGTGFQSCSNLTWKQLLSASSIVSATIPEYLTDNPVGYALAVENLTDLAASPPPGYIPGKPPEAQLGPKSGSGEDPDDGSEEVAAGQSTP